MFPEYDAHFSFVLLNVCALPLGFTYCAVSMLIVFHVVYILLFVISNTIILSADPQTYIGSILAAVNPYQPLPGLYERPAVELYSRHHLGEISPHIFAVANECYRSLWKRLQNQCVLIRWVTLTGTPHFKMYFFLISQKTG